MAGTLAGLSYLHGRSPQLIHRDVKAGNLLLNEAGVIKLADFGVSAQIGSTLSKRGTVIGTPFWMAPEVISGGPQAGYNTKADVWSLGITAIELAEGQPPNSDMHPMRAIFLIPTRPPPTLQTPHTWSADFVGFVERCLQHQVNTRSSTAELLRHPFAVAGQQAQQGGLLGQLMDVSLEPLREWRMKKAADDAAARAAAEPALDGSGTQEIDLNTLVVHNGGNGAAADGTMVVKGGGTMRSAPPGNGGSGTTVVRPGDGGTMVVNSGGTPPNPREAWGTSGGGGQQVGTTVINDNAGTLPAFMRQFEGQPPLHQQNSKEQQQQPPQPPAPATPPPAKPRTQGPGGVAFTVNTPEAAAAAAQAPVAQQPVPPLAQKEAAEGKTPGGAKGHFDFAALSIAEIEEELANQEANFQRDVGRLRKQYERRGRALRSARAAKMAAMEGGGDGGEGRGDSLEAAASAALAAAAATRKSLLGK